METVTASVASAASPIPALPDLAAAHLLPRPGATALFPLDRRELELEALLETVERRVPGPGRLRRRVAKAFTRGVRDRALSAALSVGTQHFDPGMVHLGMSSLAVRALRSVNAREVVLWARGIEAVDFWRFGHPSVPAWRFTEVEALRCRVVELPCHQDLDAEQLERVADAACAVLGRRV